jgi:hypothetical protein
MTRWTVANYFFAAPKNPSDSTGLAHFSKKDRPRFQGGE